MLNLSVASTVGGAIASTSGVVVNNVLNPIAEVSPKKNALRGSSGGEPTPQSHKKPILGCCNNGGSSAAPPPLPQVVTAPTPLPPQNSGNNLTINFCAFTSLADQRLCPLPALAWAEAADVWRFMCRKDERASLDRDSTMLYNHPGTQQVMAFSTEILN